MPLRPVRSNADGRVALWVLGHPTRLWRLKSDLRVMRFSIDAVRRLTASYLLNWKAMLLDELHAKKTVINALGSRYGARRIRVFGSVARGEKGPDSDVDFLVDFPRGYDLFRQRLPLAEKLSELLHRSVEVIPEHELNRHIKDQVLKEAVEL